MQPVDNKKNLMKKKIPTLVGLGVLVVGLVVGTVFLGAGPGVFAPRATAETTPEKIKLTNITDSSFTVSFLTPGKISGFVKYGTESDSIKSQIGDDRDQLSGTIGEYGLHHITVRGLKPATDYYYLLGTGSNGSFDNNSAPFTVKTAQRGGAPSAAKTAYGSVLSESGSPASGTIVYATITGVGEMSALVKSSGSWAIPLSNARKADGSGYAQILDTDQIALLVQGTRSNLVSNVTVAVNQSQPVEAISLGVSSGGIADGGAPAQNPVDPIPSEDPEPLGGGDDSTLPDPDDNDSGLGGLGDLVEEATQSAEIAPEVIDFEASGSGQIVTTGNPIITGMAAPNVTVELEINSETTIVRELIADAEGNFELDLEQLKQTLEPGEHTATYTYTDPTTGLPVTKTITFTVEDPQLGLGGTSPYGSGNPYSIDDATESTSLATRSALPATKSAVPVSGSVGTTMALILGGLFFIMAGGWSYYLATQIEVVEEY